MRDEQVLDDQPEDWGLSEGGKIHGLIIKSIYPIQRPFRGHTWIFRHSRNSKSVSHIPSIFPFFPHNIPLNVTIYIYLFIPLRS